MKINKIMTSKVGTISSNATITSCAARMRELNIGSLVVMNGLNVEGIVTTWDITSKCLGSGKNPIESVVHEVMTSPVHTAKSDTDVMEAARVMADRKISRLPVIETNSDELVGIITFADISQAVDQFTKDVLGGWKND
ncbi:MAG: CBS domain-containing protein [Dehalococcoidia bacterium]|nr:CBS domain-containing protein [Dehalococcoidia bacterium]